MSTTKTVITDSSQSQISAIECIKSLCIKLCQSLFVKLIILMLSLYFGGLVWFFYSHATSWSQLYHLCHESSTEFVSTVFYDYHEYSPIFINTNHKNKNNLHHNTNNINKCESNDILNCEMERQQEVLWSKTNKNRDHCVQNVRDTDYEQKQVPQKIIDKHKHNKLNQLLSDISSLNGINENNENTLSIELNLQEIKREFPNELIYCNQKASQYLTDFAPVLGFHVLCFHHFSKYSQSLVIAYMDGYKKKILPSIPYKNRKKCIVRNVIDNNNNNNNDKKRNNNNNNNYLFNSNIEHLPNGTYYVTNECERIMTPKQANPKYLLIEIKSMKDLRRHLQNHLINDIGSYDQYTIEGMDISKEFVKDNIDNQYKTYNPLKTENNVEPTLDPTKSPETEKFYDRLEFLREERKERGKNKHKHKRMTLEHDTHRIDPISSPYTQPIDPHNNDGVVMRNTDKLNNKSNIISQYRKNPYGLYYPNGQSVSYYLKYEELFNINSIVFMFEGGRFMWPGVERGHIITLPIGPNTKLETINMRPLIFSITGLITAGEVEYIRNKSLPRFNRSEVGLNEEKKVSESRTCESAWLFGEQDLMVNSLKNRCERILQIPKNHMEDMEVVRYKIGQRFDNHYDAFQQHDAVSTQSQILLHGGFKNRIATILYYLSNIDKQSGGYTIFPRYDLNIQFDDNGIEKHGQEIVSSEKCCNQSDNHQYNGNYGFIIKPKSGKTILFYNMLPNGELDPAALHGGCLLKSGTKWAANQWVWNRPFNQ